MLATDIFVFLRDVLFFLRDNSGVLAFGVSLVSLFFLIGRKIEHLRLMRFNLKEMNTSL